LKAELLKVELLKAELLKAELLKVELLKVELLKVEWENLSLISQFNTSSSFPLALINSNSATFA
jgi:hypothetical protein